MTLCVWGFGMPSWAAELEAVDRAVVQLRTATKKGTGFYISDHGYLLTNFHVIDGAGSVEVCSQAASRLEVTCDESAEIVADDPTLDVALLRLKRDPARPKPFLSLGDSDLLATGDAIRLFGFPDSGGDRLTISSGQVTGFFRDRDFVKVDASLSHGSSGGAMLDSSGTVVGMTMAILREGDDESGLIIPISKVKTWLGQSGFGENTVLGESLPALLQSEAVLQARLDRYLALSRQQVDAYDEITATYEKMRTTEAQSRDAALEKIDRNERSERERVDAYLENFASQADAEAYAAEAERVQGLWDEFAAEIASRRQKVEDAYTNNLRAVAQLEAIALEKAGVADYSLRITETRETLSSIRAKIKKLKRAAPSPTPTSTPVDTDDAAQSYMDFGSMQPQPLGGWELRSVAYQKNSADFAFLFWRFAAPLPAGSLYQIEAVITDLETGKTTQPLVVRKKFLLFRYQPGSRYQIALSAKTKNGETLKSIVLHLTAE